MCQMSYEGAASCQGPVRFAQQDSGAYGHECSAVDKSSQKAEGTHRDADPSHLLGKSTQGPQLFYRWGLETSEETILVLGRVRDVVATTGHGYVSL